jgi:protoheme IX farnesyltransferase
MWQSYLELTKPKLARTVVLTTGKECGIFNSTTPAFGYLLAPAPFLFSDLLITLIGTSLTVASAHTLNQWAEVEYDAIMSRTKNRVLPRGEVSLRSAFWFGVSTGTFLLPSFHLPQAIFFSFILPSHHLYSSPW